MKILENKISDQPLISSRRNSLVRRLRVLSTNKGRIEFSSLLLEGTQLLKEALKNCSIPHDVIATNSWYEKNHDLIQLIPKKVLFHRVTPEVLEAALTTINPDGVAAIVPLSAIPQPPKKPNFILALDRLQDPGNLGTLFRTALAAEVDCIWLSLGADPLSQKVLRASAGAVLKLPYVRLGASEETSLEKLAEKLSVAAKSGFQVIATYVPQTSKSVCPYWELDWNKPTVLVLGNEGSGLHSRIRDCCTNGVTLPHSDAVQSLNVASAAVPLLLERQRAQITSK